MEDFNPEFIHEASTSRLIEEISKRVDVKHETIFKMVGGLSKALRKVPIEILLAEVFERRSFSFDKLIAEFNEHHDLSFILSTKYDHKAPDVWVRGDIQAVLRMNAELAELIYEQYGKE